MNEVEIRSGPVDDLEGYARIPISFLVERVLEPDPARGPMAFRAAPVPTPWWKDYDREQGHHPTDWCRRFDTRTWTLLSAWLGRRRVGGLILVHGRPEIDMLEGREDLALIWDLRVHPDERGTGIGTRLMEEAERVAQARGCTRLKVETQNINVGACRLYEACGFRIAEVDPRAYPDLPGEVRLLLYKRLEPLERGPHP